uniref:Cation-transporting ATPase n=1 Tax=Varanus komodoensis TaxID=61221 RepID=A0A8D2KWH9_VARKO
NTPWGRGPHALVLRKASEMFGHRMRGFHRALCAAGHVLSCRTLLLFVHWKPEWGVWASCESCDLAGRDWTLSC